MEKGWRSSRWAAAHPSSLGYWKKKKGEEKYKNAKAGKITRARSHLQEGLHERVGARYARSNPTPL
nr:MAG TPA: hypothetical protein [Caudoviricetes sp.]